MIANESSCGVRDVRGLGTIRLPSAAPGAGIAGLAVVAAAVWGTGVFGALQSAGGFAPPDSQSQQEAALAARTFGRDAGDVVLVYASKDQTVHSAAYRSAVTLSLARLPRSRVTATQTYWSTGSPQFASADGRVTYAVLELAGATATRPGSPTTRRSQATSPRPG